MRIIDWSSDWCSSDLGDPIPLISHAKDARLHAADGRSWIDAISSWWVTTHGHAHPRIMAAIRDQSEKLDQLIFAGWTHEPAETLAAELIRITPAPLTRAFFSDSGSTSVEVALKMALGYWFNIGEPRHRILVLERSEEHTSELQSLMRISYAVFCLKKKKKTKTQSNLR